MSDVPLPEPDFYCAPKSGKVMSVNAYKTGAHHEGHMRGNYEPVYYHPKMHAHAAAVSAAENARLRKALKIAIDWLHEDCCPLGWNVSRLQEVLKGAGHE